MSISVLNTPAAKLFGIGVLVVGSFVAGCAVAAQPHMHNALNALRNARSELQIAEPNKGGHRERAIELIDRAIGEVQRGIDFAR